MGEGEGEGYGGEGEGVGMEQLDQGTASFRVRFSCSDDGLGLAGRNRGENGRPTENRHQPRDRR